jgi:hypothetical protein
MTPLYGHISEDTAYLVTDYPYGRLRCWIKFWLETDPRKGVRFCSQTQNPKNLRWNAPKKSTYARLGGAMYLDDLGHCTWRALSEYAGVEEILKFLKDFGPLSANDILKDFVRVKTEMWRKRVSGEVRLVTTVNGVPVQKTPEEEESERARLSGELAVLEECWEILKG